jgi:hypothetical protein
MNRAIKGYEKELTDIKDYVNSAFNLDISSRRKQAKDVRGRTLYFKLALKITEASYVDVSSVVNRDHSTVSHTVKHLFPEMDGFPKYIVAYNNYIDNFEPTDIDASQNLRSLVKSLDEVNKLKSDIKFLKTLLKDVKEKAKKAKLSHLTDFEVEYRALSYEDAVVYGERANMVLKSFKWKHRDSVRKEEFETISCSM